jgi:hypothetical protein
MQITRKIIVRAVVGAGGMAVTAATIKPVDADTNVAAWLKLMGWDDPPAALVSSMANDAIFWVGVVLLLIAGFSVVEWFWQKRKELNPAPITGPETWGVLAREILAAVAVLPYNSPPNKDGPDHVGVALQAITARFHPRLATALAEIGASRIMVPDEISRSPVNQFCWQQRAKFLLDSEQKL